MTDYRTVVACITCGEVFDTNTDELGFPLDDQCNDCWMLENEDDMEAGEESE